MKQDLSPRPPIVLPHKWSPRPYQMPLWTALEQGKKRAVCVWHRRAGKDLTALNWLIRSAVMRRGAYWHALPTYAQGRKIVWDGMTSDGCSFLELIPPELIVRKRDDEMKVWIHAHGGGESTIQIVGAEKYDHLVGTNPVGIVLSEYSIQTPAFWNFARPILAENGGWALFLYTPRGRNHGFKLFNDAKKNANWFVQLLTVDDTGSIMPSAIEEDRISGMPEEMIQQEYYCSWDAGLVGSYYGDVLAAAQRENRIGGVPWDPAIPVTTAWDLGVGDMTCIWFMQKVGPQRRIIDFYYNSGQGLEHYVRELQNKPYVYAEHLLPHDVKVKELGSGKSRFEILRGFGLKVRIVRKLSVEDGINAVRQYLPKCWIDEEKCIFGLSGLRSYTKRRIETELGPKGEPVYADQPEHGWASHPSDAFRYLAVGERSERFTAGGFGEPPRIYKPNLAIV